MRPRAVQDTRYAWAYLFGAVRPERAVGAGLVRPHANTEAMTLHLAEISRAVSPGAHAALVMDRAGWRISDDLVFPVNITLVKLPSYAPELDPIESVWAYLRGATLAHRLFTSDDDIVTACCEAWNSFLSDEERVRSINPTPRSPDGRSLVDGLRLRRRHVRRPGRSDRPGSARRRSAGAGRGDGSQSAGVRRSEDPQGRVLAHARAGGMISPARWEIPRGAKLFRFGARGGG